MMDMIYWVSWACLVFTIGMFAASIPSALHVVRKRSTQDVPFLPYVTTNLNNILWCYYGSLIRDSTILLVNLVGSTIQVCCIVVYLYFTTEKRKYSRQAFIAFFSVTVLMVYFKYYDLAPDVLIKQLGLAASSVTIAMYASPLAQLREVINSKSTRSMSFPLSVATFIAASLWTLYGFLLDDLYVMIPNIPGMMTSIIRFCLFFIYRSSDKTIT